MGFHNRRALIVRGLALGLLLCCATFAATASSALAASSLYERIGAERLARVVDEYVQTLSRDARTSRAFANSDLARIKRVLTEQLCELTGGPCEYRGDSMREVHAGHGITESEFLRGVELLRAALIRHEVSLRDRNELLALLAPMKGDVVQP